MRRRRCEHRNRGSRSGLLQKHIWQRYRQIPKHVLHVLQISVFVISNVTQRLYMSAQQCLLVHFNVNVEMMNNQSMRINSSSCTSSPRCLEAALNCQLFPEDILGFRTSDCQVGAGAGPAPDHGHMTKTSRGHTARVAHAQAYPVIWWQY